MTPEGKIVAHLKREAKGLGMLAIRMHFGPGAKAGYPDFAVLGPSGLTLWCETKAPGKPLRPLQDERRKELQALGHLYAKPDTKDEASKALLDFAAYCKLMGRVLDV